ncbi:MAG: hypothetical protein DMG69_11535 [Acidobacteria bacterium]|nr:MAG: hypothetical protein DMG69_11535 [Acidobacteriota bacterium]
MLAKPVMLKMPFAPTEPMGGKPKSKASALASAEVRRLWEEPAEETSQNQRSSVGILSLQGEEDVNEKLGEQKQSVG